MFLAQGMWWGLEKQWIETRVTGLLSIFTDDGNFCSNCLPLSFTHKKTVGLYFTADC
jgi:hypothetical protein